MKFYCPGCQVTFSVPDDKIPEGKGIRILCPKCRNPVERADPTPVSSGANKLESPEKVSYGEPAPKPAPDSRPTEMFPDSEDTQDNESTLEVVEEGVKTSLLCFSDASRMEMAEGILRQLDYFVSTAVRAKTALAKLHQNRYDLVIVDELFDAAKASDNLVLHHIQLLPMHVRRGFFMCLVSETLPSLDRFMAFRLGVDMILNIADLDKIKIILVREMKDHSAFYKVYNDELARKGQL